MSVHGKVRGCNVGGGNCGDDTQAGFPTLLQLQGVYQGWRGSWGGCRKGASGTFIAVIVVALQFTIS